MSGRFRMKQCTFGQTIHTVSNGFLFFDVFGSPDEAQRVCDRLNELTEENLEEHKQTVLKFMNKLQAVCVKDSETIVGVLLFSRNRNMICCLAVDPEYRQQGLASILLRKALAELDRSREITVSTFRENDEKGIAPRALYKKFGFQEGEMTEEFGYPNQVFVLHP